MPFKLVSRANTDVFTIATPQTSAERVRLVGGTLTAANTVTITFQTSTGNTALTGAMTMVAGVPLSFPPSPPDPGSGYRAGHMQSNAGDNLQFVLGGSVQVSGVVEYIFIAE